MNQILDTIFWKISAIIYNSMSHMREHTEQEGIEYKAPPPEEFKELKRMYEQLLKNLEMRLPKELQFFMVVAANQVMQKNFLPIKMLMVD